LFLVGVVTFCAFLVGFLQARKEQQVTKTAGIGMQRLRWNAQRSVLPNKNL
jgi:hypothetical protein